ncbi:MAG: nucleotidyltransferase [Firmicutes bacterium]|nr:nucleotidyltransferase [Bacillota bacterium]
MRKPKLVIMAAGLGNRYGGLKQIQPVGAYGQAIMEYSLYDALRAGFEEFIFIISPAMEKDFPTGIRGRIGGDKHILCAVQRLTDLPAGYALPQGREKPWGTGHAVLSCRGMLDGSFAVINADDFYGPSAFEAIYGFLTAGKKDGRGEYAMVGYELKNTLSASGYVARGICRTDRQGTLAEIHERTHIISTHEGALYTEDGRLYRKLPDDAVASMNLWGFTEDFIGELERRFAAFLDRAIQENPLKAEYFLPEVVGAMLRENAATVRVLPCAERWYGVTYREDLPAVAEAVARMTAEGKYPERLWG